MEFFLQAHTHTRARARVSEVCRYGAQLRVHLALHRVCRAKRRKVVFTRRHAGLVHARSTIYTGSTRLSVARWLHVLTVSCVFFLLLLLLLLFLGWFLAPL